jgi:hypothetical protein
VARGDVETVTAHLRDMPDDSIATTYRCLARATVDRAVASGMLSTADAASLRANLGEESS